MAEYSDECLEECTVHELRYDGWIGCAALRYDGWIGCAGGP